ADLIRNLYVIDPSTKKVLWKNSDKIDLAVGRSVTDSVYWNPTGVMPGDYLVLYQGVFSDNSVVTLGSGGIRILKDETAVTPSTNSIESSNATVDIPVVDVPVASPASDLAVSICADKSIYMDNDTITYTVDYKNLLASKSGDFELTVQIPEHTTIVDAGGGVVTGAAITWKLSALEGLESGKKVYKVKLNSIPKSEYMISNTAKITGKNLINTEDDQSTILVMARTEKYGKLSHKAYLKGYPGNFFGPERQITRAEVAAIFARIMILTAGKKTSMKDVPENHWASEYISAAIDAGIFTGYKDNSFHPDAAITRAELAAVVSRYYNIKASKPLEIHFNDISGHWALNYIEEVNRFKFTTGYEDGSFRPDEKIKRSETVTMVNRMLMRGPLNVKIPSFTDINGHWAQSQIEEGAKNHEAGLDSTGNETAN
ncbi:MAG TPA: S-layer homology domain-containing protein, partial [Clostridia bacterium]